MLGKETGTISIMKKITKFNHYIDPKPTDVVVFADGTKKIVKKAHAHNIYFTDGTMIDFWFTSFDYLERDEEKINEAEQKRQESLKAAIQANNAKHQESIKEVEKEDDLSKAVDNALYTYEKLFKEMENADKTGFFSKYFWHLTAGENLVEIIKTGSIKARRFLFNQIPYDNEKLNKKTENVLESNRSRLTISYVRFYLNPRNAGIYDFLVNADYSTKKDYCAIAINKYALRDSPRNTYLFFKNANKAFDVVYSPEHKLNGYGNTKFTLPFSYQFNFRTIYSIYNPNESKETKERQMAEFLVHHSLGIEFIEKIFFNSDDGKRHFLEKIRGLKNFKEIEKKCIVDGRYFFK